MAKSPKCFNRLYVNMIKAGEAGGALELILQRLADFQERSESLKRKVKGAMIYPVVVMSVAVGILTFIMIKIVPEFEKIFDEFDLELPKMTLLLVSISQWTVNYWYLIPGIPITIWLMIKLIRKFKHGRIGWDQFIIKVPIFGALIEKNVLARTTRTLGTLIASGVPILEALTITRDTAGNAMFEQMYQKVSEAIREGEAIAKPMKENSIPGFHPVAAFFWFCFIGGPIGLLIYLLKFKQRIVDDIVVNMVDVGEETGELDTMLYKVADTYDEEVAVLTDRPHQADGTAVDPVLGRHGRLHRDRLVHPPSETNRRPQRLILQEYGERASARGHSPKRKPHETNTQLNLFSTPITGTVIWNKTQANQSPPSNLAAASPWSSCSS